MSHEDTLIEPATGITLICGSNNIGKSAISIALYFLSAAKSYQSQVGRDWMIRHGQKQATVTVEVENKDGLHKIQWRRKKNSEGWTVDGVDSDRGSPPELDKILKLKNECFGGKSSMQVHLSEQKEPLFILNETGSYIAECFASTNDTKYILKMQSVHKRNILEAKKNKEYLENDLETKEVELSHLSTVKNIVPLVENAENLHEKINKNKSSIDKIDELLNKEKKISCDLEVNSKLIDKLSDLNSPPELEVTADLFNLLKDIEKYKTQQIDAHKSVGLLKSLKTPPELIETESLKNFISNYIKKIDEVEKVSDVNKKLNETELELQNEFKEYLKENPHCPTCGEVLNEKFLGHIRDHG